MKPKTTAHLHTHVGPDGTEHTHSHEAELCPDHTHRHEAELCPDHNHNDVPAHGHTHSHQNTKAVLNRLSRAGGHLEKVKRMVENQTDCSEVLIQLSAVIAALNSTGKMILKDHIANCIVDAVESGDVEAVEKLNTAVDRFVK